MFYQKVLNNIDYIFQAKLAVKKYNGVSKIFYEDRVSISNELKKIVDLLKRIGLLTVSEHSYLSIKLADLIRY